jgi:NAD(P)-dependent dehydrogenase (short-subunit alcohol dehydrogenase family)
LSIIDKFRLDGKVAFITGGSKGLGKAMALAMADAGANLVIVSRHRDEGQMALEEISERTGAKGMAIEADVRIGEQVEGAVSMALERFGKIDILVTSAGVNIRHPIEEFPEEEFRDVLDTNLFGTWICCKVVGRHMMERRYGRVITIGSILSVVSIPGRTAYAASKGGVLQLTRTLALEWAPYGITVNCICPGPFVTEMNEAIFRDPKVRDFFLSNIPLGRFGEMEEIGSLALFLASDACPYMTGAAIFVDGGWTAR